MQKHGIATGQCLNSSPPLRGNASLAKKTVLASHRQNLGARANLESQFGFAVFSNLCFAFKVEGCGYWALGLARGLRLRRFALGPEVPLVFSKNVWL